MAFFSLRAAMQQRDIALSLKINAKGKNRFPLRIYSLDRLEELKITAGNFGDLPERVGNLQKLRKLSLRSCGISTIPTSIGKLQNLEELDLSFNQLTELPSGLGQLKNLKRLILSGNRLKKLPSRLDLPKLQFLHLENNQLEELPESIGALTSLLVLRLNGNKIHQFPKSLGGLSNLLSLSASSNRLCNIPNSLEGLKSLRELNLSSNQLSAIPEGLLQANLSQLNLNYNQLEQLPNSIKDCRNLINLQIRGNRIRRLPDLFGELSKLELLALSNNQLCKLPKSMEQLGQLKQAYLSGNPFEQAPLEVLHWDRLAYLSAEGAGLGTAFLNGGQTRKILTALQAAKAEAALRKAFYHLICANAQEISLLSRALLLQALSVNYQKGQSQARQQLTKLSENTPLGKGSEICILGKINFKKTEVRDRLRKLGIRYSCKIRKTTTHLVLGDSIKSLEGSGRAGLNFMTEQDLNLFFQQQEDQYLRSNTSENKKQQDKVARLLASTTPENVALGLGVLQSGGVPDGLITEIFLVAKNTCLPNDLRKTAKNYLKIHASQQLQDRLKKNLSIFGYIDEARLTKNLVYYTEGTELDAKKVGQYIYEHSHHGLKFWLRQWGNNAQRSNALRQNILA